MVNKHQRQSTDAEDCFTILRIGADALTTGQANDPHLAAAVLTANFRDFLTAVKPEDLDRC